MTSEVPQGSILGPLMYIIFMNSLSKISLSPSTKIVLYADDILLYRPINSVEDSNLLQSNVNSILEWVSSHGLVPNHAKTKLLNVTRSRHPISTNLKIDRVNIPPSPCMKYLGVTLSAKFMWSDHVSAICKSSKRQIGLIHRQLHQAPSEMRRRIVNSTIQPKLEYCCTIWDPHLKQDIANLDNVQKFAGRVVTHNWSSDITELQQSLNWQPLRTRRRNIKLKVVYNIIVNNLSRIPRSVFTNHPHPSPPVTPTTKLYSKRSFLLILTVTPFLLMSSPPGIHYQHMLSIAPPLMSLNRVCVLSLKLNNQLSIFIQQQSILFLLFMFMFTLLIMSACCILCLFVVWEDFTISLGYMSNHYAILH